MDGKIVIRGMPYYVRTEGVGPPVLWLHGFTGSHESFLPYAAELSGCTHIFVDLPGHGQNAAAWTPARMRIGAVACDLTVLMRKLGYEQFTLIGYSMGGRIALALAVLFPHCVSQLVLESASPGLVSWRQRADRRAIDASRADRLRQDGLDAFLKEWEQLPLFAGQVNAEPERVEQQRHIRSAQSADGLRMSLLGHGTGVQPSYWAYLMRLQMPVYLLTGDRDEKFTNTAVRMLRYLQHGRHWTSKAAGHTIHIEDPERFSAWMHRILQSGAGGEQ